MALFRQAPAVERLAPLYRAFLELAEMVEAMPEGGQKRAALVQLYRARLETLKVMAISRPTSNTVQYTGTSQP
jgi:hypothetical protein